MVTLREWLTEAGFDWENGRIVVQYDPNLRSTFGMGNSSVARRMENSKIAREITPDDPVLDNEFNPGFGAPEAPPFIADDGVALYFPEQYDGATGCVKVYKRIDKYLDGETHTPYPGGG